MNEELLAIDEIQGNSLAGFNKDHQTFLFLRMGRTEESLLQARTWLRAIAPEISTVAEVYRFNQLFRALRARLGRDPHGICATWVNIAFSAPALRALTSPEEVDQFADVYFRQGMATWSGDLGDPSDTDAEGHPSRWVVGGDGKEADILLMIASDSAGALHERVTQVKASFASLTPESAPTFEILWEQPGATLASPLTGHEHFGFKDGVSQPGVRGLVRAQPEEQFTPRRIDPTKAPQTDTQVPEQSRPGQPLVWPGQFLFGYHAQQTNDARQPAPEMKACPAWGMNGSYVVFRRLRQDVGAFWSFMRKQAARLSSLPGFTGLTAMQLASRLVGRWPSGAPLMRSPTQDAPLLGDDEFASNDFQFVSDSPPPLPLKPSVARPADSFPRSKADLLGMTCPMAAHIRKVNPRDTVTEQGNRQDVLTRLLLRRGVPFGPRYPFVPEDLAAPTSDADDEPRGLLFISYQTSISRQFAFLQKNWANHISNPHDSSGVDPLIGQYADDPRRYRYVDIKGTDGKAETLEIPVEWVVPTGGGFFFSPSISTLRHTLGREPAGPSPS